MAFQIADSFSPTVDKNEQPLKYILLIVTERLLNRVQKQQLYLPDVLTSCLNSKWFWVSL